MQTINRIQAAIINANAGNQGALVAIRANAHRAYPSFVPCEKDPVVKRFVMSMPTWWDPTPGCSSELLSPGSEEHVGTAGTGTAERSRRFDSRHDHLPATAWATFILNRALHG